MARDDGGFAYDPETVVLLREVLDDAWRSLSAVQRARMQKSELALRILRLANRGERDPVRLRVGATAAVFSNDESPHTGRRPPASSVRSRAPNDRCTEATAWSRQ